MGIAILVGILFAFAIAGVRIIPEYERGVIFRLGRFVGIRTAGLRWIIPGVDRMVRIGLREIVMDVPSQEVITRDNVSVKVNAVLYFRVLHPEKSVIQVENYLYGTSQLAQTTLRSVCGQAELDELLAERDRINQKLQEIIDLQTEPWGVKVRAVEVKQIDLPQEMQRVMAKQAEAEREKRAKVTLAEGESLAAQRLADAARTLSTEEAGLQLRYLQTLNEIAGTNSSTTVFPFPIDLMRPFLGQASGGRGGELPPDSGADSEAKPKEGR
ncbi:MAG: slipin family protein [Myxococcota bacterium]|nr:slipin family protein [Myxococcota bacterium]